MRQKLSHFPNWWISQFKRQGGFGRVTILGFSLIAVFFACFMGLAILSMVTNPFRPEATSPSQQVTIADNGQAEHVDIGERSTTATQAIHASTMASNIPTSTDQPTEPATKESVPATDVPSTSLPIRAATAIVLTVEAEPTNTRTPTVIPPTATNPPLSTATIQVSPTPIPPTAIPPTSIPPTTIPPTAIPPTEAPPQPTAPLAVSSGALEIVAVNKSDEYVDVRNSDSVSVDLNGWILRSEKGPQDCFLSGVIPPGQSLRIWAMAEDAGQGGFNCGFGTNIWNNSESDPAVLINPSGEEVSRR